MKHIIALCALTFVAVTGFQLGGRLSSDAIGMALGILFGIMAGIPASLMVLAAKRHDPYEDDYRPRRPGQYREIPEQPPVIVVTGYGDQNQRQPRWDDDVADFLGQREARQITGPTDPSRDFEIYGHSEEITDSW